MGFRPGNMTLSSRLANVVAEYEEHFADCDFPDAFDMVSTGGFDNDGVIGPDMVDNGISLAMRARNYDPNPVIFYAFGNAPQDTQFCYYQFGRDEDDALARVAKNSLFLPTFMVQVDSVWRECQLIEGHYVHVTNSSWRLEVYDPTIIQTRLKGPFA